MLTMHRGFEATGPKHGHVQRRHILHVGNGRVLQQQLHVTPLLDGDVNRQDLDRTADRFAEHWKLVTSFACTVDLCKLLAT